MAITGPTSCAQALPPSFKDVIALCGQSKFSTVQSVGNRIHTAPHFASPASPSLQSSCSSS
ncbi:hypothetical protein AAP_03628 [Ascosphaera apis ARSEF 7405]|uniref:Uncharacterized protein n=1 Tax=Ascosphaera apis ARSEF 7405 TaxID=392613 RepID=A0A167Y8J9_9EURO|nr:hypothetical protein AAP_03628 [Ascosphaera apis ARSEF 7405]